VAARGRLRLVSADAEESRRFGCRVYAAAVTVNAVAVEESDHPPCVPVHLKLGALCRRLRASENRFMLATFGYLSVTRNSMPDVIAIPS
jgi:hypothetical protein